MPQDLEVHGIVLSSQPIGEADKRVVLLTREFGRISAFAKNALRMNNSLSAPTRTFACGKFFLYPGKSSYTLTKAEIGEYFEEIVKDVEKAAYGCCILEQAAMLSHENVQEEEMMLLTYYALKALLRPEMENRLAMRIFEVKTLAVNGLLPDFSHCAVCRKELTEGYFKPALMQPVCRECGDASIPYVLSKSAVYAMNFIRATQPSRLFSFRLSEEVYRQMADVTERILLHVQEKETESKKMLKILVGEA